MVVLQSSSGGGGEAIGLLIIGLGLGLYFLPTIVAASRKKRNMAPILLVNLLFGWSIIGWIIALVWALTYDAPIAQPVILAPTLDTWSETEVLRAELRALQAEMALGNERRGANIEATETDTPEAITLDTPPRGPKPSTP